MNTHSADSPAYARRRPLRWWPGGAIALVALLLVVGVRLQTDWPYQRRNLDTLVILLISVILLVVWWTFFSRASARLRLSVTFGLAGLMAALAGMVRLRGMSGDMLPILEFRWAGRAPAIAAAPTGQLHDASQAADFPQFLGPNRDGVLLGPVLSTNWAANPPVVIWRQSVGAAWSGFAVSGGLALTQEQQGDDECVVARDLVTGQERWRHPDRARYSTAIAGEGPRATPTLVNNRVFTLGATGILNCLDLATGQRLWSHDLVKEYGGQVPIWGAAASPLCANGLVIVPGGENASHSLHAFRQESGEPVWHASGNPSYASPIMTSLAGVPQVLDFRNGFISGLDPATGRMLWERAWGNGNVVCASPVVAASNRVIFSSGYGVGTELLEIKPGTNGTLSAERVWRSVRMKSKFAHLYQRENCLFSLDDGVFACVGLDDGAPRWRGKRYEHGQGLLAGELYLLMTETGELVLLRPTPTAPNELARLRVFHSKTWNPIALAGDLLLLRNDREAVCLRLPLAP